MEIFGTDINLNGNEFKHLRAENLLSLPVSPTIGQIVMHTGLNTFYGYNGTSWLDLAGSSGIVPSLQAVTDAGNVTTNNIEAPSLSLNLTAGVTVGQGQFGWNADEETFDFGLNGAVLQGGQELHYHVRNNSGADIPDGTPVMATGTIGASGRITVAPMNNNGTVENHYFLGITTEEIANDTDGKVTHFGKIREIQTNGANYSETWIDGDLLYLSPTTVGALTNVAPTTGALNVPVAIVIKSHAAAGTLFIRINIQDPVSVDIPAIISEDQGNGIGYFIADREPTKYSPIGSRAIDLTITGIGEPDSDYGVESDSGFSTGGGNKLPITASNFGAHQAHGYGNTVYGYYNNMAFGTFNSVTSGYSFVTFGYSNTANMTSTVGHGFSAGGFNSSTSYWNNALGFRISASAKGFTGVGLANTVYAGSATATDRPAFTVGIGDAVSASGGSYGNVITRKDGLVVKFNAEAVLPETTISIIDSESTGRQITTREWIEARSYAVSIGDNTATEFTINHALNSEDVTVQVRQAGEDKQFVDEIIQVVDANNIKVIFFVAPFTNQYRVIVKK